MPKTNHKNAQAQALGRLSAAKRKKRQPKDFYKRLAMKRWHPQSPIAQSADATDAAQSNKTR